MSEENSFFLWKTIERPGYLGKHRDERIKEWDEKYGKGSWRMVWKINNVLFGFLGVCALYEDAYFEFLKNNPEIVSQLINEASNVYDDDPINVSSGFDYKKQQTKGTHIQDIAIRRCLVRMCLWFRGEKLIRIRQEKGDHPLSITLSPGRVPFHRPELIVGPEIKGWWYPQTVESFYQSNRILQVKT